MIKTVIFDLDGTLIDTEKYYRICWPKALAHFGYEISDEQVLSLRSLGRPFAPEYLKQIVGDDNFDYTKVREYRKQLMEECLTQNGIELKPGAIEILNFLKQKGIERAVATANDMERATRYLKRIGLIEYFDKIITADLIEKGKPSPDIYEYACKQLGHNPDECIAVEDSPNGVISAYKAGCKVVMVPDLTQPHEELSRMLFAKVDRLTDIEKLIEE